MTEDSRGCTTLAVGERDGNVVLQFPESVGWAVLDPETARQVGEAIARSAYVCRYGREPDSNRSPIGQQVQQKLVNRVLLILTNLLKRKRPPAYIASEIVDVCMREIL